MAEAEHQRNVRKTREASEDAAREATRAADRPRESTLQQGRAAAVAEHAAQAQWQAVELQAIALEDQRRAAYAIWHQTPDGQAFDAWCVQALALIDDYDRKTAEFQSCWESAKREAIDSITPDERQQFGSGVYAQGRPRPMPRADGSLYFLGIAFIVICVVVFAVMGLTALFNAGTPAFGVVWALVPLGLGVGSLAWGWLLARRHPELREDYLASTAELHAWAERNEQAKAEAATSRERRLGFDPLGNSSWHPEPWTTTPHPGPALLDFIRQAYTSFPSPAELLPLPVIEVRATQSEPVPSMRDALRRLGAE